MGTEYLTIGYLSRAIFQIPGLTYLTTVWHNVCMTSNNLRVLATAVQRYGANSTDAKAALENPNYGMRTDLSVNIQAQALVAYLAASR